MSYINVERSMFTDRCNDAGRLTGTLHIEARSLSYLHVGTGGVKLIVKPEALEAIKKAKHSFSEILRYINTHSEAVSYDFSETVRYTGKPVIPGSTIKGLCRSRIELLSKSMEGRVGACFIKASRPLRDYPPRGVHGWRHSRIWDDPVLENRGPPCDASRWEYYNDIAVCRVCDIFGTSGLASRVFFGNLYQVSGGVVNLVLDYNEKVEAVTPGSVFKGEISFIGLEPFEFGLVAIGLKLHRDDPILVGKSKYRIRKVVSGPKELIGRGIVFGRVTFTAECLNVPLRCKPVVERVLGESVKAESDEPTGILSLRGDLLKKFIEKCVEEAKEKYPWIRGESEVNEVKLLEELGK